MLRRDGGVGVAQDNGHAIKGNTCLEEIHCQRVAEAMRGVLAVYFGLGIEPAQSAAPIPGGRLGLG